LNSKGDVVGVSVATFRGGQNLNFAIPSNYLNPLLTQAGSAKPLSSTKSSGKQQSILADLGGRSTEGVVGSNFTWQYSIDAWLLDPSDQLATPVARDGDALSVHVEETDTNFAIGWTGAYRIDGAAFVYWDKDSGNIRTIFGYPTQKITHEISNMFG
jgi:hypothetical protein